MINNTYVHPAGCAMFEKLKSCLVRYVFCHPTTCRRNPRFLSPQVSFSHINSLDMTPRQRCLSEKTLDITPQQVDAWIDRYRFTQAHQAATFRTFLANRPTCQWLGDWTSQTCLRAREITGHARANDALFQVVLYNIPNRDNGGFSAGGAGSRAEYIRWVKDVAEGLGGDEGFVILEPDALAHAADFNPTQQEARVQLLREAVEIIRRRCRRTRIYLDIGHPGWLSINVAAGLALRTGAHLCAGLSVNVSNMYDTETCFRYGAAIVDRLGDDLGIVIDTSRNGAGPPPPHVQGVDRWANVPSARLGVEPTLKVSPPNSFDRRLHALLWIKVPGESDGKTNGAPEAGAFWAEGAMRLAGAYDLQCD